MKDNRIYKSEEGKDAIWAAYNSILQRWPVPHEIITVPTGYGNTSIIASGNESAPPMILLHGSSTNATMWIGDVKKYSDHYRVYAIDIIGEPGKSDPNRPPLKGESYSKWPHDIFNTLNIDKAVVVGLSLGGWMSLKFAISFPERVDKLVLLCPSGLGPVRLSFILKMIPLMFLGSWGKEQMKKIVFGNQSIPEEAERYSDLISKHFIPRQGIPVFTDQELCALTMPVMLIAGALDALIDSQKSVQRLETCVPNGTINLIPDAGHLLLDLTDGILQFLRPVVGVR